ncbi:MAG: methylcrotonoyl-CoA carboxylase, partial [Sphingomonadales bacterium]
MSILKNKIDSAAKDYKDNARAMSGVVEDLRAKIATITRGGHEKAREKHLGRGKLLPRERIDLLLDPDTPFLEFSQFAAWGMYGENIPAAG